jgi:transposase InsO family protein
VLTRVPRAVNRLYILELKIEQPVCLSTKVEESSWRWHARFCHLSFPTLQKLYRGAMVRGLPAIKEVDRLYDGCIISKQHRLPFQTKANYHAGKALELVHGDLCRPIKPATPGGKTLFLLMVDDMSRYMWLVLLSAKSDAAKLIKQVQTEAEAESGKKLKVLRTDRGGEFTSSSFIDYCNELGVRRHLTMPYSPQ